MSKRRQLLYLAGGAIAVSAIWFLYNKSIKKKLSIVPKKPKKNDHYTHFLSLRITNPGIIGFGKHIQSEIVDEYKKNEVIINSSLIKEARFHVSLNILSLSSAHKLSKFCNGLNLFENWLKIFIFNDKSIDQKLLALKDDGSFLKIIEKNNYLKRFKDIYNKILSKKSVNNEGLPFYMEGVNHFGQSVVFIDFEKECQIGSDSKNVESSRNECVLQLFRMIHELIQKLCTEYDIKCDKKKLVPHCTLMKLSKMKRREMQKFLDYNKTNNIGSNRKKKYDMKILSVTLNNDNIGNKMQLLSNKEYEMVNHIDLCAMHGSSNDGYYKIVRSFSVTPPLIRHKSQN